MALIRGTVPPSSDPSPSTPLALATAANESALAGDRIAAAYQQLTKAASQLNSASDRLGMFVGRLDDALRRLNVGVVTWLKFGGWDTAEEFERQSIGYSKVGSTWGISIGVTRGLRGHEEDAMMEKWL